MSVGGPGQILSGKYRLERELGRGGMGSVWLAQHLTLHSAVAIKLIDATIAQNPEALSRFLREAQAAASLRSPHVVQILDHGVDDGVPFIVMELLDGESLSARLERVGRLSPPDTARVLTQVARAMSKAHEAGIVHRDLKPENIFIVRNDEDEIAKVLDFGVAKSQSHGLGGVSSATRTGSVLGTPYYMSPEQAEGAKTVDQRSDIWSMGVIAWECLLGIRPFEAETLGGLLMAICAREMPVPSRCGAVPAGFDAWFERACAREMNQRFSTAKETAKELERVCSASQVEATGPTSRRNSAQSMPSPEPRMVTTTGPLGISSPERPRKKSAARLVVSAIAGVTALVAGAVLIYRTSAAEGPASPLGGQPTSGASVATTDASTPIPPTPPATTATPADSSAAPERTEPSTAVPSPTTPSAAAPGTRPTLAAARPAAHLRSSHAAAPEPEARPAPSPAPVAATAAARPSAPATAKERVDLGL